MENEWMIDLQNGLFDKVEPSLSEVFENKIGAMIVDEIYKKADKLNWETTSIKSSSYKFYTAPIEVNGVKCFIVINNTTANLTIQHNNDEYIVYSDDLDNFDKRQELLYKIRPLARSVDAKAVLERLREL